MSMDDETRQTLQEDSHKGRLIAEKITNFLRKYGVAASTSAVLMSPTAVAHASTPASDYKAPTDTIQTPVPPSNSTSVEKTIHLNDLIKANQEKQKKVVERIDSHSKDETKKVETNTDTLSSSSNKAEDVATMTAKEKAEEKYQQLVKEKGGNLTLGDLLDNASEEDFQTVWNTNMDAFSTITPSAKAKRSAQVHNTRRDCKGNCLAGVQLKAGQIYGGVLDKQSPLWGNTPLVEGHRSAGDAWIPLKNSGEFVVFSIENKAYQNPSADKEMRNDINKLPTGTQVTMDRSVKNIHGVSKRTLSRLHGGQKHGHIVVLGEKLPNGNRPWFSDGRQLNSGTSRYGEECKICLDKKNISSKDFAVALLTAKYEREEELQKQKDSQNIVKMAAYAKASGKGI